MPKKCRSRKKSAKKPADNKIVQLNKPAEDSLAEVEKLLKYWPISNARKALDNVGLNVLVSDGLVERFMRCCVLFVKTLAKAG